LFSAEYYRALFVNTNQAAAVAITPFTNIFVDSPLAADGENGLPGGLDFEWPQGRNVTNYQFADDLSWTKGNHTIKVGWSMPRDDVSDYDPGIETTPLSVGLQEEFAAGYTDEYIQNFPLKISQPIAVYNMGAYVQDQWKALSNLTVTYGLRIEHNSNPTCITNCFATASANFPDLSTDPTVPLNSLITSGRHRAYDSLQHVGYEPRLGFSWQPFGAGTHTVVRGGFGLFVDTFPATVADGLLGNVPTNIPVTLVDSNFGGPYSPFLVDPAVPGSGSQLAATDAANTLAGYSTGVSTSTLAFAPNLETAAPKVKYPTYDEYSLAIEQQIGHSTSVALNYVGNHGYQEPVENNSANACGFGQLVACSGSGSFGYNPNFGSVNVIFAGASSNYNGLIATVQEHQRYVNLQFNYQWTHALDEISNGGFLAFGAGSTSPESPSTLTYNYGNADYDVRQYVSASYVITVPHWGGPKVLVDDWQVAGTFFHNTGFPFSVYDGTTSATIPYYGGGLFAQQIASGFSTTCGGSSHNYVYGTPCAFAAPGSSDSGLANYAYATAFGQSRRNQLRGSGYTDADLDVSKGFSIPKWESAKLKLGAQFFNIFNHPNFGLPGSNFTAQNSGTFGESTGLVNTPTSILGSFLGGDAGPRLIQLKASFVF